MFYEEEGEMPEGWENSQGGQRTAKAVEFCERKTKFYSETVGKSPEDRIRLFLDEYFRFSDFAEAIDCDGLGDFLALGLQSQDDELDNSPLSLFEEGEIALLYGLKPWQVPKDDSEIPPSASRDVWLF